MENIIEQQLIGLSKAARHIGWSTGKFGGYYYSNRTPPHKIVGNKPVWLAYDLIEWAKTVRRINEKRETTTTNPQPNGVHNNGKI